jgi:hypothetical protein
MMAGFEGQGGHIDLGQGQEVPEKQPGEPDGG